jgi:DNA repair exonuclease SbcCD ATPase subunit
MRILSIDLKGFKRFAVNQIHRIHIEFVEKIIFILGTNGSGKSSLLQELSPLPAVSKNYEDNGYKKIVIEHLGVIYTLLSDFEYNKHSFLKGEEELNQGGTLSVQRELVKKEFNITPELHELYIGQLRFHQMTPAQRRYWFTAFSKSDYSYAMSVYQKLKERQKEIQNQYKLIQNRYLKEKEKEQFFQNEEAIKDYIGHLKTLVKTYRDLQQTFQSAYVKESQLQDTQTLLAEQSKKLIKIVQTLNALEQKVQDPSLSLQECEYKALELQTKMDLRHKDQVNYETVLHEIQKNSQFSLNEILKIQPQLEQDISSLMLELELSVQEMNELTHNEQYPEQCIEDLHAFHLAVLELTSDMELKDNAIYTQEAAQDHLDTIKLQQDELVKLQKLYQDYKKEYALLEHAKEHNETQCPKCSFVWFRGFNEEKFKALKTSLAELETLIDKTTQSIQDLQKNLVHLQTVMTQFMQYRHISRGYPRLVKLRETIYKENKLATEPKSLGAYILNFKPYYEKMQHLSALLQEQRKNARIMDEIKRNKNHNLEQTKERLSSIIGEIVQFQKQKSVLTDQIRVLKDIERLQQSIEVISQNIEAQLLKQDTQQDDWRKQQMRAMLEGLIGQIESDIEKQTMHLNEVDRHHHLLRALLDEQTQLEQSLKAVKILAEELSPTTGLIAKGMQSFINIFLKEINLILKKIWSYPLELKVYDVEETEDFELDYKFKLRINDRHEVADIQSGSSAMKEVIDLAFRKVCMKFLSMQNYPLYLDEFGHTMDNAHRQEAARLIHDLADYTDFSEIFLISHFESSYGSFKNAQIVVLCPNNIVIPRDLIVNDHVVIE